MIKNYCHICKDYTDHKVEDKIASCSVCNEIYDENRKRYIVCGKPDNEKVIEATKKLLEEDPNIIIIPEELAFKHKMEIAGITEATKSPYLSYPIKNYDVELEDFKYSHLSKKERNAKIVPVRTEPKIQRNALCPCGSGKKYKHCCITNEK